MMVRRMASVAGGLMVGMTMLAAPAAHAQVAGRLVLPEGSVMLVKTQTALESSTAKAGQVFETTVVDSIRVDNYTVIPSGSRIRGVVTMAQAASRQQSGVIEVKFDRLTLTDGKVFPLVGKLTSTDAAERRQIDSDPNARVVLVGGRSGVGAAIAGAGSANSSTAGILSALGGLLSEGRDVRLAAGTPLAVQLDQGLVLTRRGVARAPDAFTIYTGADQIRAAQQALAAQNYYRGAINGQLNDATQRALFEYQVDRGIIATGNLDGRTAQALGLSAAADAPMLSAEEAAVVRRGAQGLVGQQRIDLGIATTGRLDARREYSEADLDVWFALSSFADNASLYESVVRLSGNVQGAAMAGKALIAAARRVDTAFQRGRPTAHVQTAWRVTREHLQVLDPTYR
jgi:peptidoglycan hydrolase-like protein with peptidoglycan-binding domain